MRKRRDKRVWIELFVSREEKIRCERFRNQFSRAYQFYAPKTMYVYVFLSIIYFIYAYVKYIILIT